jgi:hypothetical protein
MGLIETAVTAALPFPLNILAGLVGGIRKALAACFTWITEKPWHILAAVAALIGAVALYEGHEASKWRRQAEHAQIALDGLKRDIAKATADGLAKQAAADMANAAVQDERNRRVHDVEQASEQARAGAVADYIASHRVRFAAVASGGSGTPDAGVHQDTGKHDGQAGEPGMVAISGADLDNLTREALQGAIRYEYLKSLVDSGQAVVVQ